MASFSMSSSDQRRGLAGDSQWSIDFQYRQRCSCEEPTARRVTGRQESTLRTRMESRMRASRLSSPRRGNNRSCESKYVEDLQDFSGLSKFASGRLRVLDWC